MHLRLRHRGTPGTALPEWLRCGTPARSEAHTGVKFQVLLGAAAYWGARGKADLWEDGCATTVGAGADAAGSAATRCDVSTVHPRAPACHIPSPVFLETFRNRTPMEPHLWRSATHSEAAVRSTFPSSAVPGPSTLGTSCCGRSGGAALTPPRT